MQHVEARIKAVIFDCDGTLVDSEDAHLAAWQAAAKLWGGDLPADEYHRYVGKPSRVVAAQLAANIGCPNPTLLHAQKSAAFLQLAQTGLPPIQGTVDFARRLFSRASDLDVKLAVASASPRSEILEHLGHLGLLETFQIVLSGHDDLLGYSDPEGVNKPKPYIYLHAAKCLGVQPSECIVIEDTYTGVKAASSAGCVTVAVPNAYTRGQDFSEAVLILDELAGVEAEDFFAQCETAFLKRVSVSRSDDPF